MSSSAAQPVRSRLAPHLVERARRLTVVPDSRQAASRLPFVILVSMLLVGGVVGLLLFNTSMQQASFAENKLQDQATNLAARQQTLTLEIQRMQDPQTIAEKAQKLGMVYPGVPAFLDVPSGKVDGTPTPADRSATPPLYAHISKPRAARVPLTSSATKPAATKPTATKPTATKPAADTPAGATAGRRTSR